MQTTRITLLMRVRNVGDQLAWAEFDAIYRPILYRYALAYGLVHNDAEDVVQDCMSSIQKHIGDFDYDPGRGRFKSWLRVILNNRCRNLLRHRREQQVESGQFHVAQESEPTPEECFDRIWMEEHLQRALQRVREETEPESFDIYVKHVLENRPVKEVCEASHLNPAQLYKLKWRLTQRVKDHLMELLGDEAIAYA